MTATAPADELLVADSFRVRAHHGVAQVRGWHRHVARFSDSAHAAAQENGAATWLTHRLPDFLTQSTTDIAAAGAGFPRLELWRTAGDGLRLQLSLRSLPPLGVEVSLRTAADIRVPTPERKGPNIERFGALNRTLGAEAVRLNANGHLREGATTSLLWWEGDTLCRVPAQERVCSVTEALLMQITVDHGIPTVTREIHAADLTGAEVWAVNALHGIRTVSAIDGVPMPKPDPDRLTRFRAALDQCWEPVRVTGE